MEMTVTYEVNYFDGKKYVSSYFGSLTEARRAYAKTASKYAEVYLVKVTQHFDDYSFKGYAEDEVLEQTR